MLTWSEGNNLNTAITLNQGTGGGPQSSALSVSGYNTAMIDECESWNGTSWSEVNDVNTPNEVIVFFVCL